MLVAAPARKFTSGLHVLAVPTLGYFAIETLLEVYYRDTVSLTLGTLGFAIEIFLHSCISDKG